MGAAARAGRYLPQRNGDRARHLALRLLDLPPVNTRASIKAGRRYPNLVDNMWAARTVKPRRHRPAPAQTRGHVQAPAKDPKGGLTAGGETVPRTIAAARRIAAKGERLLERYRDIKKRTSR